MEGRIQMFLGVEIVIFLIAALTHFEVLFDGNADRAAGIAESIIGAVLLVGLVLTSIRPAWGRSVGIAVQAFALLGTFVGLTLLVVVGPRTALDIAFHLVMVLVLIAGLVVTVRSRPWARRVSTRAGTGS